MSLLLDDVITFLENEGLIGGATGWTGFKAYLPPDPDKVIVVTETGGAEPELEPTGSTAEEYDEPSFQIRGRGDAYGMEALRTKMGAVYRALQGGNLGADYVNTWAQSPSPLLLKLDEQARPGLTWNFRTMRLRSADT